MAATSATLQVLKGAWTVVSITFPFNSLVWLLQKPHRIRRRTMDSGKLKQVVPSLVTTVPDVVSC